MSEPQKSPAMERAMTYASIFVGLGDRWAHNVPVDAEVSDETGTVHLQGGRMERVSGYTRASQARLRSVS